MPSRIKSARRYLSPGELGVTPLGSADVDRQLAGVGVVRVLRALAWLLHHVDIGAPAAESLVKALPSNLQVRARAALRDSNTVLLGAQPILHLMLRALDVSPEADPKGEPDIALPIAKVAQLSIACVGLVDPSVRDAAVALLRSAALTADTSAWRIWVGESFGILPHIEAHCASPPYDIYDFETKFTTATGLSFDDLFNGTAVIALLQEGATDWPRVDASTIARPDRKSALRRVAELYSQDLENARNAARADLRAGSWSFEALYMKPVIRMPDGSLLVCRPTWLRDRASADSIVNVIGDVYRNMFDPRVSATWQSVLGRAHEDRIHEILTQLPARSGCVIYTEDELRRFLGPGAVSDALIVQGRTWIAVDFVRHAFRARTIISGDVQQQDDDLNKSVVSKVKQCDETLRRALQCEALSHHPAPRRFFPLVVNGARMPLNPFILKKIASLVEASNAAEFTSAHPKGTAPSIVDTLSFTALASVAGHSGVRFANALIDWRGSDDSEDSLYNFLVRHRQKRLMPLIASNEIWVRHVCDSFGISV